MERQGRIELLVICLEGSGSTIELRTQENLADYSAGVKSR